MVTNNTEGEEIYGSEIALRPNQSQMEVAVCWEFMKAYGPNNIKRVYKSTPKRPNERTSVWTTVWTIHFIFVVPFHRHTATQLLLHTHTDIHLIIYEWKSFLKCSSQSWFIAIVQILKCGIFFLSFLIYSLSHSIGIDDEKITCKNCYYSLSLSVGAKLPNTGIFVRWQLFYRTSLRYDDK